MENQTIMIGVEKGEDKPDRFFLKIIKDGKTKESYRPESKEVIMVWLSAILNGFEPPRKLLKTQNENKVGSCTVCGTTKHPILGAHCKAMNCPHEHSM